MVATGVGDPHRLRSAIGRRSCLPAAKNRAADSMRCAQYIIAGRNCQFVTPGFEGVRVVLGARQRYRVSASQRSPGELAARYFQEFRLKAVEMAYSEHSSNCSNAAHSLVDRAARLALCVCSLVLAQAAAAQWVPNETRASAQADLIDYEFSQSRAQFAWNDELGNLWIGNVDRATGLFVPADGRAILVDPDAMRFEDAQKTKNGPEWVSTSAGDLIVYTKYAGAHSDNNSRIGLAQQNPDGSWYGGLLGSATRKAPYASSDPDDPAPRLTYVDNKERHYWRELWDAGTEKRIADFPDSNYPVRHVRGARAVAYPLTVGDTDQIFYRDLDTDLVTQLTFDAGNKYEVWMWRAPEFGNELVFMTLVDQIELRVYRELTIGSGGQKQWTPIYSKKAPRGNKIFSPEPFVWNGKSYIFMAQSVRPNKFRSEIWIANIDTGAPIFRRITDNALLRTRTDPEVFITDAGPRIYFNRLVPDDSSGRPQTCRAPSCSEGVWFADPGLTP